MTPGSANSENSKLALLSFHKIKAASPDEFATLFLNRADAANAMSAELMDAITTSLTEVQQRHTCRALIIGGKGKHFSAGADLNWMKASAQLSHQENIVDAQRLTAMFETLAGLSIPTISVVRGAAYGGAVGLVACCDVSIAVDSAKFCLSEARLGIAPAVIMPYLARKMHPGQLRRLSLSAQVFSGSEAKEFGLVEQVGSDAQLDAIVRQELNALFTCGPIAQAEIKTLIEDVKKNGGKQGSYTADVIAKLRTGSEGQAGLTAFFAKTPPPWNLSVSDSWSFNALSS